MTGTGASPAATDTVKVHYKGTLPDGKEFDSSYKRGQPAEFPLNRVIKCWTEGVQRMKVGGTAKLVCPSAIAYGERGVSGLIPPNATLLFEIELLGMSVGSRDARRVVKGPSAGLARAIPNRRWFVRSRNHPQSVPA